MKPPALVEQTSAPSSVVEFDPVDRLSHAANDLAAGQIYLRGNPLLRQPLVAFDIKPRSLSHWGTTPGINLVYARLQRLIVERDLSMLLVTGAGHGGPALTANTWLDGSFTDAYPSVRRDGTGMGELMRQVSSRGMPSHAAPQVPGSINEGGELGHSLADAFGAAFDNPDAQLVAILPVHAAAGFAAHALGEGRVAESVVYDDGTPGDRADPTWRDDARLVDRAIVATLTADAEIRVTHVALTEGPQKASRRW